MRPYGCPKLEGEDENVKLISRNLPQRDLLMWAQEDLFKSIITALFVMPKEFFRRGLHEDTSLYWNIAGLHDDTSL